MLIFFNVPVTNLKVLKGIVIVLKDNKYIMFDKLLDELDKTDFENIIADKIVLLEDKEIVKSRHLEYLLNREVGKKVNKIYINLTNRCNSDCVYCFAHVKEKNYDLEYETLIPVLKNILDIAKEEINICFFGGEPTLRFDLIKRVVAYIEDEFPERDINFEMITNGILLKKEYLLFIKQKFKSLTISIDGDYDYMLNNRIKDKKVLNRVYDNIEYACQLFKNTSIRSTITEQTKDVVDTYEFIKRLGAKRIRFKPVSGKVDDYYLIKDWNYVIEKMNQLYPLVLKDLVNDKVEQVFPYSMYIKQFERKISKITGCSMNILTISENGKVYPCYRFVENEKFLISTKEKIAYNKLPLNIVYEKNCVNCWCQFICGGGCYADSYIYEEKINEAYSNHCKFIKETIKQSIYLYKKIKEDNICMT